MKSQRRELKVYENITAYDFNNNCEKLYMIGSTGEFLIIDTNSGEIGKKEQLNLEEKVIRLKVERTGEKMVFLYHKKMDMDIRLTEEPMNIVAFIKGIIPISKMFMLMNNNVLVTVGKICSTVTLYNLDTSEFKNTRDQKIGRKTYDFSSDHEIFCFVLCGKEDKEFLQIVQVSSFQFMNQFETRLKNTEEVRFINNDLQILLLENYFGNNLSVFSLDGQILKQINFSNIINMSIQSSAKLLLFQEVGTICLFELLCLSVIKENNFGEIISLSNNFSIIEEQIKQSAQILQTNEKDILPKTRTFVNNTNFNYQALSHKLSQGNNSIIKAKFSRDQRLVSLVSQGAPNMLFILDIVKNQVIQGIILKENVKQVKWKLDGTLCIISNGHCYYELNQGNITLIEYFVDTSEFQAERMKVNSNNNVMMVGDQKKEKILVISQYE